MQTYDCFCVPINPVACSFKRKLCLAPSKIGKNDPRFEARLHGIDWHRLNFQPGTHLHRQLLHDCKTKPRTGMQGIAPHKSLAQLFDRQKCLAGGQVRNAETIGLETDFHRSFRYMIGESVFDEIADGNCESVRSTSRDREIPPGL